MLHLPALFFLLLLALMLILPHEELPPPLPVETSARDIIWSRMTAEGEVIHMHASALHRRSDGVVTVEDVRIQTRQQKNNLLLRGTQGETDNAYRQIVLRNASGELTTRNGARVSLSLKSARYHLDGSRLHGTQVNIHQTNGTLSGENFLWEDVTMRLQGNVRASFLPPPRR